MCLSKEVAEDEKNSLRRLYIPFPFTNKYGSFPAKHPGILTSGALINRSPREFYDLIKCDSLPPSFLFHPVLPYRAQGKLMFPLCRACARNLQQPPCEHTDEERMLSGS